MDLRYACRTVQPEMELLKVCARVCVNMQMNACTCTPIIEITMFFCDCPLVHFSAELGNSLRVRPAVHLLISSA